MTVIFQLAPTFTKSMAFFSPLRAYQSQFLVHILNIVWVKNVILMFGDFSFYLSYSFARGSPKSQRELNLGFSVIAARYTTVVTIYNELVSYNIQVHQMDYMFNLVLLFK